MTRVLLSAFTYLRDKLQMQHPLGKAAFAEVADKKQQKKSVLGMPKMTIALRKSCTCSLVCWNAIASRARFFSPSQSLSSVEQPQDPKYEGVWRQCHAACCPASYPLVGLSSFNVNAQESPRSTFCTVACPIGTHLALPGLERGPDSPALRCSASHASHGSSQS